MCNKIIMILVALVCIWALGTSQAMAKVTAEEAAKLSGELTPMGAEKAGNADGTIPAWTGEGVKVPASWKGPGTHLPNPFPEDKPLFVITAKNMDQYGDKLTDGQKAMFKTYPDTFNMPVYKSRRTVTYPDWYVKNTYQNALNAEIESDGNGVKNALRGIPFPIPQSGVECIQNHLLRYQGIFRKSVVTEIVADAKGKFAPDVIEMNRYSPVYDKNFKNEQKQLSSMRVHQIAPPRVAGDTYLILDYINAVEQPRNAWRYFAGQRRVRRAPVLAYDTPVPTSRGLRTFDDLDMFYGAPDRSEWTLLGKKEIYIPYNCYDLGSPELKYTDIVEPGHIKSDLVRYELHRVWVLEAKLKSGKRHIYSRRISYIDEDSWNIVLADKFDDRGALWRCQMSYLAYYWELPAIYKITNAQYDLISRTYYVAPLMNEGATGFKFHLSVPPDTFWKASSLRRSGVR